MNVLLVAINAKYIHSNLGVYSLKAYADQGLLARGMGEIQIEMGEYTINHQTDTILQDIYRRKPDMIGFSCYIWNISYVRQLIRNLRKVLPETIIWLGGPEVSYDAGKILTEEPSVTGVMIGEGEETFLELAEYYGRRKQGLVRDSQLADGPGMLQDDGCPRHLEDGSRARRLEDGSRARRLEDGSQQELSQIPGIVFRDGQGKVRETCPRELLDMDQMPFPYESLEGMEHRIIYYESSRGCPYRCSYCLSSVDKRVRFRSLALVKQELDFFLQKKVPQVKFVDRTFNCKKSHCLELWRYLLEHDNGVTNFHFEISADLIDEEQLDILKEMRPGLIQLEIGVQTVNEHTIREIHRKTDLVRLEQMVNRIRGFGNIHQHLDLIAGLPYEDFDSFCRSFDRVYRMRPDQLQLGFLKVLKGSPMAEKTADYELQFHEEPPYEVLSTRWLDYDQVLRLKAVEEMVEIYYNSGQFRCTLTEMERRWESPWAMFEAIAEYYEGQGMDRVSHSRLARYEILYEFLRQREPEGMERYRDLLMCDVYLRENVKSRPGFARDQSSYKAVIRDFFIEESRNPRYLKGYEAYDSRQISKMAHVEAMGDGSLVVFDYKNRDPLSHNAKTAVINR